MTTATDTNTTNWTRTALLVLAVAVAAAAAWTVTVRRSRVAEPVRLSRGQTVPAFSATGLDGERLALDSRGDAPLFLHFWATWCPPCVDEMPRIARLRQRFSAGDVAMITISQDRSDSIVRNFYKQSGTSLPTIMDPSGAIGRSYGITGVPETFLIDREGRLVTHFIGPQDWMSASMLAEIGELVGGSGGVPVTSR